MDRHIQINGVYRHFKGNVYKVIANRYYMYHIERSGDMTLLELQNILGERIRIASDTTLAPEQRKQENEISQTIASLAKQMINNADVVLRTDKLVAEGKIQNSNVEKMIDSKE